MPLGGILKQPRRMSTERDSVATLEKLGILFPPADLAALGNRAVSGDTSGLVGALALGAATSNPAGKALGSALKAGKKLNKSRFKPEIEVHPDGAKLVNMDVKPDHAKLLSELGHDFSLDKHGKGAFSPVQVMGREEGRTRVRINAEELDEFLLYVDDFVGDKGRGSKIPPGFTAAIKAFAKNAE